jgi:hypothetical protein
MPKIRKNVLQRQVQWGLLTTSRLRPPTVSRPRSASSKEEGNGQEQQDGRH